MVFCKARSPTLLQIQVVMMPWRKRAPRARSLYFGLVGSCWEHFILVFPKGSDELPGGPAGHLGDAADPCRLEDESCGGPEEGLWCFFFSKANGSSPKDR